MTERNRRQWEKLPPEQRAAVERIQANHRTPGFRAEEARVRDEVQREFPPRGVDEAVLAIASAFKLERERAGLSLADVSARTGVSQVMLAKFENGETPNPNYPMLKAFARAVGCRLTLALEREPTT